MEKENFAFWASKGISWLKIRAFEIGVGFRMEIRGGLVIRGWIGFVIRIVIGIFGVGIFGIVIGFVIDIVVVHYFGRLCTGCTLLGSRIVAIIAFINIVPLFDPL